MKTYEIKQGAAQVNGGVLFTMRGSNLAKVRQAARIKIKALEAQGVVILTALRSECEIVPRTLENLAKTEGKSARKARALLKSGRYSGKEELSEVSGRWEVPA